MVVVVVVVVVKAEEEDDEEERLFSILKKLSANKMSLLIKDTENIVAF